MTCGSFGRPETGQGRFDRLTQLIALPGRCARYRVHAKERIAATRPIGDILQYSEALTVTPSQRGMPGL